MNMQFKINQETIKIILHHCSKQVSWINNLNRLKIVEEEMGMVRAIFDTEWNWNHVRRYSQPLVLPYVFMYQTIRC